MDSFSLLLTFVAQLFLLLDYPEQQRLAYYFRHVLQHCHVSVVPLVPPTLVECWHDADRSVVVVVVEHVDVQVQVEYHVDAVPFSFSLHYSRFHFHQ